MGRTARRLGPSLEISIALLLLTRSLVGGVAAHTLPCGAEIDSLIYTASTGALLPAAHD